MNAVIAPNIWLPLGAYTQLGSPFSDSSAMSDLAQPKNYTLHLVGRLRTGLTIESAKPRLPALAQRLASLQSSYDNRGRELQIQKPPRDARARLEFAWPSARIGVMSSRSS